MVKDSHEDLNPIHSPSAVDDAAFESLYRAHARELIYYVARTFRDKETCEEIVSEVFEQLWTRRDELSHVVAMRPYIYQMVRRRIVDHIRSSDKREEFEQGYIEFVKGRVGVSEGAETIDLNQIVLKGIEELPEKCRDVARLRIYDNLSYKEIAERLKISVKTVEKHVSKALSHLRGSYKKAVGSISILFVSIFY